MTTVLTKKYCHIYVNVLNAVNGNIKTPCLIDNESTCYYNVKPLCHVLSLSIIKGYSLMI